MRNLLTNYTKRLIQKEYYIRLVILATLLSSSVLVIASVFLVPSYILAKAQKVSIENQARVIKQSLVSQEEESLSAALQLAQEELDILASIKDQKLFSERLKDVVREKPEGINLSSFTYKTQEGKKQSMVISGKAYTRNDLLSFEKKLRSNLDFSSVEFPVSNLAKDKDIDFSIALEYES